VLPKFKILKTSDSSEGKSGKRNGEFGVSDAAAERKSRTTDEPKQDILKGFV